VLVNALWLEELGSEDGECGFNVSDSSRDLISGKAQRFAQLTHHSVGEFVVPTNENVPPRRNQ
jgi:hypothetical protein